MKKAFLIIAVLLLVLVAIAGTALLLVGNSRFGLFESEALSYEAFTEETPRLQLVIQPDGAARHFVPLISNQVALPGWVPVNQEDWIQKAVPRQIALVARSDYKDKQYKLTFFVNERRGGPFIVEEARKLDVLSKISKVHWDAEGLSMPRRGALLAKGYLPLPDDVLTQIGAHWTQDDTPEVPCVPDMDSHLELTLDNRTGEAYALAMMICEMRGLRWVQFKQNPMFKLFEDVLVHLEQARLKANWVRLDEVIITVRLHLPVEESGTILLPLNGMILPQLQETLKRKYGLTLSGNLRWKEELGAVAGTFSLRGLKDYLERQYALAPAPAAAE